MEILRSLESHAQLEAAVFDVDNCLYENPEYFKSGRKEELDAIALELGMSNPQDVGRRVSERKQALTDQLGRDATLTEVVLSFSLTMRWWCEVRESCYEPERFLRPNANIRGALQELRDGRVRIVAASNSPRSVATRVLRAIRLHDLFEFVWGPEDGGNKIQRAYWERLVERIGVPAGHCAAVGDRRETDCAIPLSAGFGTAIHVSGVSEIPGAVEELMRRH